MKKFLQIPWSGHIKEVILCLCLSILNLSGIVSGIAGNPAFLTGFITNSLTGNPIIGAKIQVNSSTGFSVIGGAYFMVIDSAGTFPVLCSKPGFDAITSSPVTFQSGITSSLNFSLQENLNPPTNVNAVLDTSNTFVHISYSLPSGPYELIYDDGIQDDFTVWATQGNMNAVRFTPVGYPVTLTGGSVNIGTAANYPPGSTPLVPFQIKIFDASGPGDSPGNLIAGPFDVIPTALGWVEFQLSSSVTITGGSFFIAMVQGGNAPNASGMAIDQTNPQFRSYSRFITGGLPWMPAQGNFMMRAFVTGPGGPLDMADFPEGILGYTAWRLRQGEELNPAVWVQVTFTPNLFLDDNAWPVLPCGPWRWGVKAVYSGNRLSPVAFSNVIGKCWTVPITLKINLTCAASTTNGAFVQMKNLVYPDTLYSTIADSSGFITFPAVWKGSYEIYVKKFGYIDYYQNYSVEDADTVELTILQKKSPPSNLVVDERSLFSVWDVPYYHQNLFNEDWSSGNFTAQGWSLEGNFNWKISTSMGNPAPSAMFSWNPPVIDYEQSIVSKEIPGEYSPILTLSYDIFLDNYSTSALNRMAVEIKYGQDWYTLKTWDNLGGNIPWTHDEIDISQFSDKTIRLRFRAYGEDSYQINAWYIDNISVVASESAHLLAPCIFGYNFYLDNVLIASIAENNYTIPGELVKFDSSYNACVKAIYTSGYSEAVCDSFTSLFLWPPANLAVTPDEANAFLTWDKPSMPTDSGNITPPGLLGYNIYRNSSFIIFLPFPDSLSYNDQGLEPGTYYYEVSARYDLTPYGFPGQEDNSPPAGPVMVDIHYGHPLPFFESWDQGNFDYNEWRFRPEQGNWTIAYSKGIPPPSAEFTGNPMKTDYIFSLESAVLDASMLNCAKIWMDFDIRLDDQNSIGTEELSAEIFYNGNWIKKATFKNDGSFDWTSVHLDISSVKGKGFRIGFRATGLNSTGFVRWSIDNIAVYAVCLPAGNLSGEQSGNGVLLQWSPPGCNGGGFILNEGFEKPEFPPQNWTQVIHNTGATWSHTDYSSVVGVHTGNYSAGITWDYNLQNEWIIAHDVFVNGNLRFWSMAFQGSTHGDHYYVKVSTDNEVTWETLFDLSSLPPYPGGYNQWQVPYDVDLSPFLGEVIDIAWQAWDGTGQGCWYYWAIDDCSVGNKKLELSLSDPMYDIYKMDPGDTTFLIVNEQPVSDTSYLDPDLEPGLYNYYIMTVNESCSQSLPSDTVSVDQITYIENMEAGNLKIFPNPAYDIVTIKSVVPVARLILFDIAGKPVKEIQNKNKNEARFSVEDLLSGLYVMKVFTAGSTITRLLSVNH